MNQLRGAKEKGMIFIQPEHPIVKEMVQNWLTKYINEPGAQGRRALEPTNTTISDFDGVIYQVIVDPSNQDIFEVNLSMRDYQNVLSCGGDRALTSLYGQYQVTDTYSNEKPDLTLRINAGNISEKQVGELANLFGLLKRNILGAPLIAAFEALQSGGAGSLSPSIFNVRDEEQFIIIPSNDRVSIVTSFCMAEDTDAAFADQILDKMAGASKSSNGPNIKFTRDIPAEVSNLDGIKSNQNTVGFLLFSVSESHISRGNMDNVVDLILDVRHYVHYHIKASKAHLHQRMRAKVKYFLQVLNRAKPEVKAQKKNFRVFQN